MQAGGIVIEERKRILLVDDERKTLDVCRRELESSGGNWEIVFVQDARKAIEALENDAIDVAVMDVRTRGTNGGDLLTEIAEHYPETVRLVLIGEHDRNGPVRARNAHRYLMSPCSGELLASTIERMFALRRLLEGRSLQRLVASLKTLPSSPLVYQKLMTALDSPDASTQDIGRIISSDMAMSVKVLQIVNSALFNLARPVSHPADAARFLGIDTIKALVLTAGIFSQFHGPALASLPLDQLQRHSLEVAQVARAIARRSRLAQHDADDAFLAGVVHDIGKLILVTKDAEMYERALKVAHAEQLDPCAVEREAFGASHGEIGSYLLWLWGLPDPVIEAVAFHHEPAKCLASGISVPVVVHAADALAHEVRGESGRALDQDFFAASGLTERIGEWRQIAERTVDDTSL